MKKWTFLFLLGAAACSKPAAEPPAPTAEPEPRLLSVTPELLASGRVRAVAVARRSVAGVVVATGQIEAPPDGAAAVTSPITARVREIAVRRGDVVKKGDRLATLDAGEIARVRSDLARARARRSHAEKVLAQEEKLLADRATSERSVSDARSAVDTSKADEQAASSLLSTFGAAGGSRLLLRSPISGTVVKVDGVVGAPVEATSALFRVVDTGRLLVRADVPENDAGGVEDGAMATITMPGKSEACSGKVEGRTPSVDPDTRTVPFRVRLGDGCGTLLEGGFVDVAVERPSAGAKKLVAVPRDAVVTIDDVPLVFVQRSAPHEFEPRTVRVAEYGGAWVFLEDGVKDAERVVDKGALLLKGELMRSRLE
jgi:cobalt-zinc-cadmium efflux system membrane fusion protein